MKVYVMTECKALSDEIFLDVTSSFKKAEAEFRKRYPHMRKFEKQTALETYWTSTSEAVSGHLNDDNLKILFIREKEVK